MSAALFPAGGVDSQQDHRWNIAQKQTRQDGPPWDTSAALSTITREYKNDSSGSTSPGHLLSRLERNICSSGTPAHSTSTSKVVFGILSPP